jgi:LPXTG-site transpeptidase (sortase) family protein
MSESEVPQPETSLRKRTYVLGIIVMAVIAIVTGIMLATETHDEAKPGPTIRYSTNNPSETKPSDSGYSWRGAANEPRRIILSSIDTEGYIQKVGVDQKREIAVPNNVHTAGWFVDSVKPGDKGLSIIDGHVDGQTESGIFEQLNKLQKGDAYTVEFGDGTEKKFEVTKVFTVKTEEAANILYSQDPNISNQLNLITCTGQYNRSEHQYDKRVVVYSKLVN